MRPFNNLVKKVVGIGSWLCALGIVGLSMSSLGEVVKVELPLETATFKPGSSVALAISRCMVCHSSEYISSQPPLGRNYWKGNIQKMQQKYGAVVLDSEVDLLTDYLVRTYGTEKTPVSFEKTTILPFTHPENNDAVLRNPIRLAELNGCTSCHNTEKKIVGPAFKDVAAKYRGKSEGMTKVSDQIGKGGGGQWGTIPMPAYSHLTQQEIKILAEWVLKQ